MDKITAALAGDRAPGLYRVTPEINREALEYFCQEQDFRLVWLDGASISNKAEFLQVAALALHFPTYFGHNWDAFEDCLTDLDWLTGRGHVLVYTQPENFASTNPKDWKILMTIFRTAVKDWLNSTLSLYVLFETASSLLDELDTL
jgi:hypothetical protein